MTLEQIKTASLSDLFTYIETINDKAILNCIIYELACRIYVPFSGVNFDDLLISYGYQMTEKDKVARENKSLKVK